MSTTMIRVDLEIVESWGVGGVAGVRDRIDLPIQVDPRGDAHLPYVPSTSLVGALRRHLGAHADDWLGPQPGALEASTGTTTRIPSTLRALGSRVDPGSALSEYGATAIDPVRRAAKERTLRTERRVDVLPRSVGGDGPTRLSWYLQHDGDADPTLLESLREWQPVVGRRRSTGHGRARVAAVTAFTVDLRSAKGLTWWLDERAAWLAGGGNPPADVTVHGRVHTLTGDELRPPAWSWAGRWRVVEPVHVGALGAESASDAAGEAEGSRTVKTPRTAAGVPIVPGSSWKGLFRHRVEHILTLCGVDASDIAAVVEALFGTAGSPRKQVTGHRGFLRFRDAAFTSPDNRKAARVVRTHVAIDRISGGAHEGLLFAVDAVDEGAVMHSTIESTVELPAEVKNLLMHVVRDIHDGFVGVGAGTTRGYGRVTLGDGDVPSVSPVEVKAIVTWAAAALAPKEVVTA